MNKNINWFKLSIISTLQSISLFLIVIIPLEYLLTEKYCLFKVVSSQTKTIVFLFSFLIVFSLNYFSKNFYKLENKLLPLIVILFFGVLVGNKKYCQYYNSLQQQIKIFKVNDGQNWSIQGMKIKIEGRAFGEAWRPGKVFIGDMELFVRSWSADLVIAEQPVPDAFLKGGLYLIRYDGEKSNKIPFRIRDPIELVEN